MLWNEQQVNEQTLNNLINIPQLLGNRLQLDLEEYFIPKTFYTTLMTIICDVLKKCHVAISTGSHGYSLNHIGYLASKIITSGYHGNVLSISLRCASILTTDAAVDHMITFLDSVTSKDMIWQRICCTLINHLSVVAVDTFVEYILLYTKPSVVSIGNVSSKFCCILQIPHELQ